MGGTISASQSVNVGLLSGSTLTSGLSGGPTVAENSLVTNSNANELLVPPVGVSSISDLNVSCAVVSGYAGDVSSAPGNANSSSETTIIVPRVVGRGDDVPYLTMVNNDYRVDGVTNDRCEGAVPVISNPSASTSINSEISCIKDRSEGDVPILNTEMHTVKGEESGAIVAFQDINGYGVGNPIAPDRLGVTPAHEVLMENSSEANLELTRNH